MSERDDGGPAFPSKAYSSAQAIALDHAPPVIEYPGMSLRDYFAAHAMIPAMLASEAVQQASLEDKADAVAIICYRIAGAMLKVRKA